jgi:catechol 2,3-dioxygenase-like lactoylglutathione lyase family enzyme
MDVTGITWAGTRTERFEETVRFFRDIMGIEPAGAGGGFASLRMKSGAKMEIFGPDDPDHDFMTTGPVVGFGVTDVEAARAELERAGIEFIGSTQSEGEYRWAHFRGPDGNVYEITSG